MNPRGWTSLYGPLAAAALALCVILLPIVGWRHLSAIAGVGIVAPPVLAWVGGRLTHATRRSPSVLEQSGSAGPWFALALVCIACAKFGVLGLVSSKFVPSLHDEWSYLFGAETLALGRLSNPPPAAPEFFDAFHVLSKPRWVTRYPPGHPAALALGVLVGQPWLVLVGLAAGTVVWIYLLGRELGGETVGKVAGVLAVLAPGLDYLASAYLSQSSFLFAITGCYVSSARAVHRRSPVWSLWAGALGGWAILTRPYSAVALGSPLAAWFLARVCTKASASNARSSSSSATTQHSPPTTHHSPLTTHHAPITSPRWLIMAAAALPLLGAMGLFAAYNQATTGSPWLLAWSEYNRQFEPDNTLGFAGGSSQPIAVGLNERKALKARTIAVEKQRFTWQEAIRRATADPHRFAQMIFPAVGFYGLAAFVPFAFWGSQPRDGESKRISWLLASGVAAHYLAYSFFYSTWHVYGYETMPFVIVLVATGLTGFWQRARDSDWPMLILVIPLALLTMAGLYAFVQVPRFIQQRREDTAYQRRFGDALRRAEHPPLLVFVRLDRAKEHPYDLIHNSPDLAGPTLVVLDLGSRNAELAERFGDRRPYMFEEANWTLTPWAPPPRDGPARSPVPRFPATAANRRPSSMVR